MVGTPPTCPTLVDGPRHRPPLWHVRHTIIDVPPDNSVYVGVSSNMEKIRWDIQRDQLGAQLIRDAQDEVDRINNGDSNASYDLDNTVEDINRVIGVVDALGHERF